MERAEEQRREQQMQNPLEPLLIRLLREYRCEGGGGGAEYHVYYISFLNFPHVQGWELACRQSPRQTLSDHMGGAEIWRATGTKKKAEMIRPRPTTSWLDRKYHRPPLLGSISSRSFLAPNRRA